MSAVGVAGWRCAVIGASSGVGAAIATELAARGASVAGFARRFPVAADVAAVAGKVLAVHLDVTDTSALHRELSALGELDALIFSAGNGAYGPLARASLDDFRQLFEVHAVATLAACQAAIPALGTRRGCIAVIGSSASVETFADCGLYTAVKAAQSGLVRVLREELRPLGIRLLHVVAGAADTAIWEGRKDFERSQMMRPRELAAVVVDAMGHRELAVEELHVKPLAGSL